MKKALLVIGLVAILVLSLASAAMAFGYNPTEATSTAGTTVGGYTRTADTGVYSTNPHGGYTSASNKCKTCHAVHGSTGTYRLLQGGTDGNNACDYCHIGAGAHSNKLVYGYAGVAPTAVNNGHTISTAATTIPDNSTSTQTSLVCNRCHSVHGAGTIGFADGKRMILRADPLETTATPVPDSAQTFANSPATVVAFCQKCHDSNSGSSTHVYAPADNQHAWSGSQLCGDCHNSQGQPHAGAQNGYKMLTGRDTGAAVTSNNLDDACRRCHLNGAGNQGIGETF
ncbi:MAG: cytochrome c3 family protein [Candidatus Aquicultorales bacterium]